MKAAERVLPHPRESFKARVEEELECLHTAGAWLLSALGLVSSRQGHLAPSRCFSRSLCLHLVRGGEDRGEGRGGRG